MASSTARPPTSASTWRWIRGVFYIIAVAVIWIAASFVVQSVVGAGVSPFLIAYICNSLFVIYIPIIELKRFFDRTILRTLRAKVPPEVSIPERETLLESVKFPSSESSTSQQLPTKKDIYDDHELQGLKEMEILERHFEEVNGDAIKEVGKVEELHDDTTDEINKPWSRKRTALIGLTICPFWFLAQLTFNLSLKYTTVTSNTILSTASSLFTFLVSLKFLGERFTWVKLASVILCMAGTIVVSVGDSWRGEDEQASNPALGDVICLLSAMFYATYTALIRVNIPDEEDGKGTVSTALVFGYIGLFNALLLAPVAVLLHITGLEPFHRLTLTQVGLIIGKGLFDNVLSDYLWARAVLLTTPTAATAGLTIQVPIAAVIDSIRGILPSYMEILGAVAILIGFFGINQPEPLHPPSVEELAEKVVGDLSMNDTLTVTSNV